MDRKEKIKILKEMKEMEEELRKIEKCIKESKLLNCWDRDFYLDK
jgi:hypothetical protein